MSTRDIKRLIGILTLCIASAIPDIGDAVPMETSPVIIVNPTAHSKALLSKTMLSAIFGMRLRKWEDGSPIKVFVLPDDDLLHIEFSKYILHVFPYQLRAAWDRLVFSGTGEEPIKVNSEQQMRMLVGSTPGAIGYLRGSMLDETVKAVVLK
ncbi:MAG: hypothetical protein IPP10_02360 [Candidatus Competibacteraceae bacterium]|nr:hypothetical protein [Candidatus Competibacteraceae bacterium]MBK7984112.1 hypothetical protein [Candidatus Competibacteraceae bacterium]MBK8896088.1 hypothetical protein [Candidatus Competibacteraceae bacterium]MBK8963497.1 hypothetical protein [Candidatus Competibacteraceae bacterium]MBK9950390.1 hypothetical protein [Candidatus Competibacteraceae bacterium]